MSEQVKKEITKRIDAFNADNGVEPNRDEDYCTYLIGTVGEVVEELSYENFKHRVENGRYPFLEDGSMVQAISPVMSGHSKAIYAMALVMSGNSKAIYAMAEAGYVFCRKIQKSQFEADHLAWSEKVQNFHATMREYVANAVLEEVGHVEDSKKEYIDNFTRNAWINGMANQQGKQAPRVDTFLRIYDNIMQSVTQYLLGIGQDVDEVLNVVVELVNELGEHFNQSHHDVGGVVPSLRAIFEDAGRIDEISAIID